MEYLSNIYIKRLHFIQHNQDKRIYSEPVYSYVSIQAVSMETARELAAANKQLPKYESFVPRLPPRNDDHEYTYITEIRPQPGRGQDYLFNKFSSVVRW